MSGLRLPWPDLERCPFCNSHAEPIEAAATGETAIWITCQNTDCDAATGSRETVQEAARLWNRRASN